MKKLITEIRVISPDTIQLWSWIEGHKSVTFHFHGEFNTMYELVESVTDRKIALKDA